ncbi:MAG: hypothetical protein ACI94Y_001819, partial [Maribacter sp.]
MNSQERHWIIRNGFTKLKSLLVEIGTMERCN